METYADLGRNFKSCEIKSSQDNNVIGKTFLSAIYCVVRCILYPGTKICIASGTRGQAINVLSKINEELKPLSPELRMEINERESRINGTEAKITFWNTSVIKVVTASDSSRGIRLPA